MPSGWQSVLPRDFITRQFCREKSRQAMRSLDAPHQYSQQNWVTAATCDCSVRSFYGIMQWQWNKYRKCSSRSWSRLNAVLYFSSVMDARGVIGHAVLMISLTSIVIHYAVKKEWNGLFVTINLGSELYLGWHTSKGYNAVTLHMCVNRR